jgi:DNA-binding response OmpR family regulator
MRTSVVLRSIPGRGSCFSLRLPAGSMPTASSPAVSLSAPGFSGRCVWIVDDDDSVRESLRLRLTGWGASVQTFDSLLALDDALVAGTREPRPDLLITDHHLGDGDSQAVVARWVRFNPGVPVLVITAETAPAELVRLDALGRPRLYKPFGIEALRAAVTSALHPAKGSDPPS